MQDLYQKTLLLSEGIFDSSIECFVKAEAELKAEIEMMIKDIDFYYYPNIQEYLLKFVEISLKYNQKEAWLKAKTTTVGKQTLADMATNVLKDQADDWYKEVQKGKDLSGNLILTYFALFEMLKEAREVLFQYNQEVRKLDKL